MASRSGATPAITRISPRAPALLMTFSETARPASEVEPGSFTTRTLAPLTAKHGAPQLPSARAWFLRSRQDLSAILIGESPIRFLPRLRLHQITYFPSRQRLMGTTPTRHTGLR